MRLHFSWSFCQTSAVHLSFSYSGHSLKPKQSMKYHFIKWFCQTFGMHPLYSKEDQDRIFCSGSYFMGLKGLYLNHWMLDINPSAESASALVWICLPHLPLIFWDRETLQANGDSLGKFIKQPSLRKDNTPVPHLHGSGFGQGTPGGHHAPAGWTDFPPRAGLQTTAIQVQSVPSIQPLCKELPAHNYFSFSQLPIAALESGSPQKKPRATQSGRTDPISNHEQKEKAASTL